MTDLSPAAQAVLDAVVNYSHPHLAGMGASKDQYGRVMAPTAAAALRAAVEQVLPEEPRPVPSRVEPGGTHMYHHERMARWEERQQSRRELLAIATELENTDA